MSQPLAIVFFERVMPGSQLVNRLQDLKYRVLSINNAAQLANTVQRESPLLVCADLQAKADVLEAIKRIRSNPVTDHVPVIAFAPDNAASLMTAGQSAGATLVVGESTLAGHLEALLEQALHIE